jgi:hypothetical protein
MQPGAHLVHFCKARNLPQMGDPACMYHRRTDVVDQLLFNELLTIEDRVENFTYG